MPQNISHIVNIKYVKCDIIFLIIAPKIEGVPVPTVQGQALRAGEGGWPIVPNKAGLSSSIGSGASLPGGHKGSPKNDFVVISVCTSHKKQR